jgi:hypothetical protein
MQDIPYWVPLTFKLLKIELSKPDRARYPDQNGIVSLETKDLACYMQC